MFQAQVLVKEFRANTLIDAELKLEEKATAYFSNQHASDIFLIAQEALANTAKHAHASRVLITFRSVKDDSVILQVIDNGVGFESESEPELLGHGLSNMSERARMLGGQLSIASGPDEGTTITIQIPIPLR